MDLKEKIIRTAYELFSEKGYEKTTVAEIINISETSKGGFYHHFKSKDDLLEAITMTYFDDLLEAYQEILQKNDRSIIDILNSVLVTINQYKIDQVEEWPKMRKVFSFSGNNTILRKISDQFQLMTTELYKKLIEKGINEGIFKVEYPEMVAGLWTREIIWIYSLAGKLIYEMDTEKYEIFNNQLNFTEKLINAILGFGDNKIRIKDIALAYVEKSRKLLTLLR
ncbi:MAG: TetR/AcrR family transcriptional regulator [Halanaerobiales bacterium]|nr:TetR/AcrR family transcriptional regulator [Halanaerobiales bacterium]